MMISQQSDAERCLTKKVADIMKEAKLQLRKEALAHARSNHQKALEYDHETGLKALQDLHTSKMEWIEDHNQGSIHEVAARVEKANRDLNSCERDRDDKIEFLRRSLDDDFSEVQTKFQGWTQRLKDEHILELSQVRMDLEKEVNQEIESIEVKARKHFASIQEVHRKGLRDFAGYYSHVLRENQESLASIEKRLAEEKTRNREKERRKALLIAENRELSVPLTELQRTKVELISKLEKVTRGTLAYRNFQKSIDQLDKKLVTITGAINAHMTER